MTIDRINNANKVNGPKAQNQVHKSKKAAPKDSVNISSDAKKSAEISEYLEVVKKSPDIRMDRVEQAKKNLASYFDGSDIKPEVLSSLTEKILRSL